MKDFEMIGNKNYRKERKPRIIYPDNNFIQNIWPFFLLICFMFIGYITPFLLAFYSEKDYSVPLMVVDYFIDGILFVDLVMSFFLATFDEEGMIQDNIRIIR